MAPQYWDQETNLNDKNNPYIIDIWYLSISIAVFILESVHFYFFEDLKCCVGKRKIMMQSNWLSVIIRLAS